MGNKIGRNDLCSCGSGKKFKTCCILLAATSSSSALKVSDFELHKLRQLEGVVIDKHLIPYATQKLPPDIAKSALSECLPEDLPADIDKGLLFSNFFIPWFLFSWVPVDNFNIKQFDAEATIAQNYLKTHSNRLNSIERRFIKAMHTTYYSFYSILEIELDKKLIVKDILLGTTHTIKERQGTHHLKRGDIIFSRILTIDEQSIFIGMAPYIVQMRFHQDLIDFKRWLIEENDAKDLTSKELRDVFALAVLDYFFELMKRSFSQQMPIFCNTDGDLIQFSKSRFKLSISPQEALKKLLPLTLSKNPQEFLNDAKLDKTGKIKKIEIPWLKKGNKQNKSWDNTIMGHIIIENNKLILETNSDKRTEKGKKLLSKYLGEFIVFQQTLIESPEQKLKSSYKPH